MAKYQSPKWAAALIILLFISLPELHAQKKYSSSGSSSFSASKGKSYSSGAPSFGQSSLTKPSPAPARPSVTPGKSYSNGSPGVKPPAGKSYSNGSGVPPVNSSKPPDKGWNSGLTNAAQKEQSKQDFAKVTRPAEKAAPTYHTHDGQEHPLNASAPQVETVRKYVTHERYVTYENRATSFYGNYYNHPSYYNDWYSPFLTGYLLSSAISANDRAYWVYCHQNDMDSARYQYLISQDADLRSHIHQLELQNAARNPGYVLPSMADNPDLQYSQDFVKSAYNPQEVPSSNWSTVGTFFFWLFVTLLGLSVIAIIVYLVAFKEYKE